MSDSFEELDQPDPRSTFYRVVEGLTVVALLVAVVLWQSDDTLQAARQLLGSGEEAGAAPVVVAAQPRSSDIRLVDPSAPLRHRATDLDLVETGSVVQPQQAALASSAEIPSPPRAVSQSMPMQVREGWSAACDGEGDRFCTASQALTQADDPTVETSWTIQHSDSGLYGIWTVPTGVLVSRGMVLIMGDGQPKTVPYSGCGAHSCQVRARLADDFVTLLRNSKRVSTEIVLKNGKTVTFDFSPEGLDAALEKLGV
ncbi:Invasion protein IalB, involved in pathogenesis [Kaistia soli DSM 19436]|uniref:Invasion protein IalB, involved in pathogenesis n=1 Tax=Kaistia soli DSM 19436 TaxID=1122133 RepID=A0A1M4VLZ8_9HYPH|nr:invasion associated locus B family protein [Kaistia soli]SHE69810.1 Invasion protein IalB, involved in pathogenesis [Kaistia soli DSM 19436]